MDTLFKSRLKNIELGAGYNLHLEFQDQFRCKIDLEPLLSGELFEPLKELHQFSQFHISEWGTIEWPNSADIASDALRIWAEKGKVLSDEETEKILMENYSIL